MPPPEPTDSRLPYPMDDDARDWLNRTHGSLDLDAKLRQLFALMFLGESPAEMQQLREFMPGAVVRMPGPDGQAAARATHEVQAASEVPLLVAGDLEGGLWYPGGLTPMPSPMSLAAANDPELTRRVAAAMARDARASGYNWSFAPVVDINAAWRSTVVGTRSYGTDVDLILAHARAYVAGMQGEGMACTGKHWPGEGQDERDQHLLTTTNPQTIEDWALSYGRLFGGLIDAGVMSIMSAHIALPAAVADAARKQLPASLCRPLNVELLRQGLGFRGLIIADASFMGGVTGQMRRSDLVPAFIAAGCDMIMFSADPAQDLLHLKQALADGRLSVEQVDEAVYRQLALKASLGLNRRHRAAVPAPAERDDLVRAVCRRAVTLVKNEGVLPLRTDRHRRVVVMEQAGRPMLPGMERPSIEPLLAALRSQGFEPRRHTRNAPVMERETDLLLYVVTQESAPTLGRIGLDWDTLHGEFPWSMSRYWNDVPAVMVSFGHPYMLFDAPQVPAYINAYTALPAMQVAVVAALCGAMPFTGRSPVDPWCGLPPEAFVRAPSPPAALKEAGPMAVSQP